MDSSRLASIVLNCRPIGRKRLGRALKGLLEGVTWKGFEGTVGGGDKGLSRHNWLLMIMIMMTMVYHYRDQRWGQKTRGK